jgi:hypothetical protein
MLAITTTQSNWRIFRGLRSVRLASIILLMPRRLLIFTALHVEARAIARQLRLWPTTPTEFIGATGQDVSLCLRVIGLRAKHLPDNEPKNQTIAILLAGLSGGLDPTLRGGDVIVDDRSTLRLDGFRAGTIHTATGLIATPQQKAQLFQRSGAIAVDMESDIVHHFASQRGIAFINVRSISDTASERLNPALIGLIDAMGRPRLGRIAAEILKQPSLLGDLLQLSRHSRIALEALGSAVVKIVKSI